MLDNISQILTQAKAIPIKKPDGSIHFKITQIVPGSVYSQLNISNGDIITHINGKKINSTNEIMTLFGKFRNLDNLSLGISRSGNEETLDYQFE